MIQNWFLAKYSSMSVCVCIYVCEWVSVCVCYSNLATCYMLRFIYRGCMTVFNREWRDTSPCRNASSLELESSSPTSFVSETTTERSNSILKMGNWRYKFRWTDTQTGLKEQRTPRLCLEERGPSLQSASSWLSGTPWRHLSDASMSSTSSW